MLSDSTQIYGLESPTNRSMRFLSSEKPVYVTIQSIKILFKELGKLPLAVLSDVVPNSRRVVRTNGHDVSAGIHLD